jgi:hypothetical protein
MYHTGDPKPEIPPEFMGKPMLARSGDDYPKEVKCYP